MSYFLDRRRATSKPIFDRETATRIGSVLLVSPFAQNLPTTVPIPRRVVSAAPRIRSQYLALVPAFREWVSKMEITAL